MDRTIAVILGGGRGSRLYPLTKYRSKPAVPFGGMYRLIDIPVSNCINSGIYRIFVISQFNSASLNRHIALSYTFDAFREGYVTVLAAEQTPESMDWYQGTADAVRKNLRHLRPTGAGDVLILSGDHIYRMDYRIMLSLHRQSRADVTVAAVPIPESEVSRFGILRMSPEGRVVDFVEKPKSIGEIKGWDVRTAFSNAFDGPMYMASMGIYVITANGIHEMLSQSDDTDFGRHVIPRAIKSKRVAAYPFTGYWEDIGTISSFYNASLALTDDESKFELVDAQMRLFTRPRFLAGAKIREATISRSLICPGSRVDRAQISRSIVGARAIVRSGATIENSVVVGADFFESAESLAANRERGLPDVGIGGDTLIRSAIIDKNARIGYGVSIDPGSNHPNVDGDGYVIRDGIVIVEKDASIPEGTQIPERRKK